MVDKTAGCVSRVRPPLGGGTVHTAEAEVGVPPLGCVQHTLPEENLFPMLVAGKAEMVRQERVGEVGSPTHLGSRGVHPLPAATEDSYRVTSNSRHLSSDGQRATGFMVGRVGFRSRISAIWN